MSDGEVLTYHLDMVTTLGIATALLIAGHFIKKIVPFLERFYIPSPVIGGVFFALMTFALHEFRICDFTYESGLKDVFMMAFFTLPGSSRRHILLFSLGFDLLILAVGSSRDMTLAPDFINLPSGTTKVSFPYFPFILMAISLVSSICCF